MTGLTGSGYTPESRLKEAERVVLASEQEPRQDKLSVQWLEMPGGVMPCCLVGGLYM